MTAWLFWSMTLPATGTAIGDGRTHTTRVQDGARGMQQSQREFWSSHKHSTWTCRWMMSRRRRTRPRMTRLEILKSAFRLEHLRSVLFGSKVQDPKKLSWIQPRNLGSIRYSDLSSELRQTLCSCCCLLCSMCTHTHQVLLGKKSAPNMELLL